MIVDLFLGILEGLLTFVAGLLPGGNVPAWFLGISSDLSSWMGYLDGLGVWMPISLMVQVTAAVMASIVIGFTIRLIRVIASFLTAGGGSAG